MKAKPEQQETDFDRKNLGDSLKMRFVQLDNKYIKKLVQRETPTGNEIMEVHEETLRENSQDLDRNIEMVYKATDRNQLQNPVLNMRPEEEGNNKQGKIFSRRQRQRSECLPLWLDFLKAC